MKKRGKRRKVNQKSFVVRGLSWLCTLALCLPMLLCTAGVKASSVADPVKTTNVYMTSGQSVTWDCVWFGSYPQTEIVSQEDTARISSLVQMNTYYETKYEAVSKDEYDKIASANYVNGDAEVDGVRYRRMLKSEALSVKDGTDNYYRWPDSSYHYFKYEPVKWRVLKVSNGQALLLADTALDNQQYNTARSATTWEKCTLRSWLNSYGAGQNTNGIDYSSAGFLKTAFASSEEQSAIKSTSLENANNLAYTSVSGGNSTTDKIFLLSESEVYSTDKASEYGFFTDKTVCDEARRTKTSTYTYARGSYRDTASAYAGDCWWFLRSPGEDSTSAAGIFYKGNAQQNGDYVDSHLDAVRPALNLDLSASCYSYAGTVCSDGTVKESGGTSDKTDGTDKKDESGKTDNSEKDNSGKTDNSEKNNSGKTDNSGSGASVKKTVLVQIITASSRTVVYKSKAFNINARTNGGGKLTYASSNKKVAAVSGTGRVTVKGYGQAAITIKAAAKGRYKAASKKITVTVIPKGVTLKKVLSPARRAIKIKWKKTKGIDGYNIWFSTKKNFKSSTWQRTLKKSQNTLSTVGLPAKKTCYVKIRSYKKVGKKKYYSKWSSVKTVKIK